MSVRNIQSEVNSMNFLDFVRRQWGEFEEAPYHQILAGELAATAYCLGRRAVFNAPPRIGMSRMASILFPAWVARSFLSKKVLVCTYSSELAARHSELAGAIANTDTRVRYVGAGDALGAIGPDIIILDNIVSRGVIVNVNAIEWFKQVLSLRFGPHTSVLVCETRSSQKDLTAHIEQNESGWSFTKIKASDFDGLAEHVTPSLIGESMFSAQYEQQPVAA